MDDTQAKPEDWPRVLFITPCAFNGITGGGITFGNLFGGWPKDRLACVTSDTVPVSHDVCEKYYLLGRDERRRLPPWRSLAPVKQTGGPLLAETSREGEAPAEPTPTRRTRLGGSLALPSITLAHRILGSAGLPERGDLSPALRQWIEDFKPDVIYTILGDTTMIDLVEKAAGAFSLPVVLHMMDDGVTEPNRTGYYRMWFGRTYRAGLGRLLDTAADRLAICDAMADAYANRYHQPFAAFHNAVDVAAIMQRHLPATSHRNQPPRLLYAGSIYPIAQDRSLLDCCEAVARLNAKGTAVEFHVHAARSLFGDYAAQVEAHAGCTFHEALDDNAAFYEAITAADVLVLPANFDAESVRYIGLSMPTKVPAYLASASPILVYGPMQAAQVQYMTDHACGLIVDEQDPAMLEGAIERIINDMPLREAISERAFVQAQTQHDVRIVRKRFRDTLRRAAENKAFGPSH